MIKISKLSILLLITVLFSANKQVIAVPITVHLHEQSTHTVTGFSQDGVHINSPDGDLNFLSLNGVGVSGSGLSPDETLLFSFDAPALDISLASTASGNLLFDIEAFDFNKNSLGISQVGPFINFIDVSGLFANSLISGFTITNLGGPFDQYQYFSDISFDASPVPAPTLLWLLLSGLITLFGVKKSKNKSV